MIDVSKAMLDPTMVFEDPMDVVATDALTRDQKIEILRRWEYDARELEVAEEEAGMAVRRPEMFDLVVKQLTARFRDSLEFYGYHARTQRVKSCPTQRVAAMSDNSNSRGGRGMAHQICGRNAGSDVFVGRKLLNRT